MSINVYWACLEKNWMEANAPDQVFSIFYRNYKPNLKEKDSLINYCPSFNSNLTNLYTLKSLYDYEFTIEGDKITSTMYDTEFFDAHVLVRSIENKFFSFYNKYIFFTDEDSLNVTFYEYPFLEDNNITTRCMIPAGSFDIGKWFRNTEFSFFLKKEFKSFKIEKNEIYSYIRFHTDKKINFIQFRYNDLLDLYRGDGWQLTLSPLKKLENFYKNFKNKKLILREIGNNIL
jgi:hypothetical protein